MSEDDPQLPDHGPGISLRAILWAIVGAIFSSGVTYLVLSGR